MALIATHGLTKEYRLGPHTVHALRGLQQIGLIPRGPLRSRPLDQRALDVVAREVRASVLVA